MQLKNVIILTDGENFETWGSITEICREHGFSYHYLKSKRFPFVYKGLRFMKVRYRKKSIVL